MKNKIAWFTIGVAVLLCIAATTPIDRLRLTSDADGGNHAVTNVNTFSVTTVNAVNLSLSGPILGTVQTNTGAIKASEFVGDGSKLTGIVAATGAIASTNGFGTNTTFNSTGPPAITANPPSGSQGSNYMGGITVITNLARTIQTNFISGLPYTNFTPTSQFVSYKFIATVAASAGDNAIASLSLIDPSEGYTVFTSISDGGETTTALSIARVVHFTVSGFVPSGAYYTFTNQCTGANTGTFVSGSGRLTQF